jgi:hypothetical protein
LEAHTESPKSHSPLRTYIGGFKEVGKENQKFTVTTVPSVETKRLLTVTGHLYHKRLIDKIIDDLLDGLDNEDKSKSPGLGGRKSGTPPMGAQHRFLCFGHGGLGDEFAKLWDWPLHKPVHVTITDDNEFEAILDFSPCSARDIEAHIVCTDLAIWLKMPKMGTHDGREIMRTYHLPLNVDPRTVRFEINEKQSKLRITAICVPPLIMHPAAFVGIEDLDGLKAAIPVAKLYELKNMRDQGADHDKLAAFLRELLVKAKEMKALK